MAFPLPLHIGFVNEPPESFRWLELPIHFVLSWEDDTKLRAKMIRKTFPVFLPPFGPAFSDVISVRCDYYELKLKEREDSF